MSLSRASRNDRECDSPTIVERKTCPRKSGISIQEDQGGGGTGGQERWTPLVLFGWPSARRCLVWLFDPPVWLRYDHGQDQSTSRRFLNEESCTRFEKEAWSQTRGSSRVHTAILYLVSKSATNTRLPAAPRKVDDTQMRTLARVTLFPLPPALRASYSSTLRRKITKVPPTS